MKTTLFPFAFVAVALILGACGEKTEEKDGESTKEKKEQEAPEKILTAMNAADFEPIPAKLLHDTWHAWEGKKVQVVGYLGLFFDKGTINGTTTNLLGNPEDENELVYVKLAEEDATEYVKSTPVMIEGTIDGHWGFNGKYSVKLIDAKVVRNGAELPKIGTIDPENLTAPVSAQSLYDHYIGWLDKEITVVGNANGVTTSTTSYGVTIRVDLTDPNSAFTKYVGVRVKDESHAQSAKENANKTRKYRGKFVGECFKYVCLEDAVEVK
ncbi:MAG: hypothetical protein NXI10_12770 [bacterium]|nr:hypothetical protein [bacterium]